jgi:hypothetical protein
MIPAAMQIAIDQASSAEAFWEMYSGTGMGGRPRPGTRVRIQVTGEQGIVQLYDGRYPGTHTFPVLLDSGFSRNFVVRDITDVH